MELKLNPTEKERQDILKELDEYIKKETEDGLSMGEVFTACPLTAFIAMKYDSDGDGNAGKFYHPARQAFFEYMDNELGQRVDLTLVERIKRIEKALDTHRHKLGDEKYSSKPEYD